MKIQCACGAKYAFDVTPEMTRNPVKLVCQNCGADNSTVVNQLIQQQFAAPAVPTISVPGLSPATVPAARTAPTPEIAPPPPGAKIVPLGTVVASASSTVSPAPVSHVGAPSLRVNIAHEPNPQAPATNSSPPAAAATPPAAPRYPMPRQKHPEGGMDKWIGRGLAAAFALFFAGMGFWGWYAWVGSVPRAYASVRFDEAAESGMLHVMSGDQVVFLHGGRLVRHDFAANKEVWSQQLIDEQKVRETSKESYDRFLAARDQALRSGGDWNGELGTLDELVEATRNQEAAKLRLHARGEAIWVSSTNRLTRYDWQSGRPGPEVALAPGENQLVANGDELLVRLGHHAVLTLNLTSGESKTQELDKAPAAEPAKAAPSRGAAAGVAASQSPSNTTARAANPRRQGTLGRVTAPALNAADANQQRLTTELNSMNPPAAAPVRATGNVAAAGTARPASIPGEPQLVVSRHGVFQVSSRNVGLKTIAGESVTAFAASVRRLGASADSAWTGELPGAPEVLATPGITLITGGRAAIALDANGRKLWEKRLETTIRSPDKNTFIRETTTRGDGPIVERNGVLYLLDGGGVSALDAATGDIKWRTPCAEPFGIVIDERGDVYANVNVTGGEKADVGVQKIDGATGKGLWKIDREGAATHASGKLLYTIDSYHGDVLEKQGAQSIKGIFYVGPFIRLRRIDMDTGKIVWSHVQERFPMDVRIEKSTFQLLFKKEVQLFKFLSF